MEILTITDPKDETGRRLQWSVSGWMLFRRVLPAEAQGNRWPGDEVDDPWWEPVLDLPEEGPVLDFYRRQTDGQVSESEYEENSRYSYGRVAAIAADGRHVMRESCCMLIQPKDESRQVRVPTLPEARKVFFAGKKSE